LLFRRLNHPRYNSGDRASRLGIFPGRLFSLGGMAKIQEVAGLIANTLQMDPLSITTAQTAISRDRAQAVDQF